jgi:hypothetical protein
MNPAAMAADRVGWKAQGAVCVVLVLALPIARADRWLVEDSLITRLESNDNAGLATSSSGRTNTLYLSGALDASRQLENAVTRLKTDASFVTEKGGSSKNRLDGSMALSQSLSDPLNVFNATLQYAQDFNDVVTNADVTQGQGRRRTTGWSAGWSRSLSERLGASTQFSSGHTAFGQELPGAVGHRDSRVSAGLSYALIEVASLGLQASRSDYLAADRRSRSKTDSVNLSLSGTVSPRTGGSVSVGVYRTSSTETRQRVVCPLEVSLCNAGLVPFELADASLDSSRRGLQFTTTYRLQVDETTDASFAVARQQMPSGAGTLVRSDTLNLGANRTLSPTLSASMNYARSRSTFQDGAVAASPGQTNLSLSFSKQLAPDLALQAGLQRTQIHGSSSGINAHSNSLSISLQYTGPTVDASR